MHFIRIRHCCDNAVSDYLWTLDQLELELELKLDTMYGYHSKDEQNKDKYK